MADKVRAVSVRTLAEFACTAGSIVPNARMAARLREGRDGHRVLQSVLDDSYQIEAPIARIVTYGGVTLKVQGRADAVRIDRDAVQLTEIKTTRADPNLILMEDYPAHWAQAEIYAALFCERDGKARAEVQLIYAGTKGGLRRFKKEYTAGELSERFERYARPYFEWCGGELNRLDTSRDSLQQLHFPYGFFRYGQREMAYAVYEAMHKNSRALIEAPTGIGKTAAALYGALKALGTNDVTRLFYLTARTTGRRSAEFALEKMRESGGVIKSVTITAKEKVCFIGKPDCALCSYASGYYDRRREALREATCIEHFDEKEIEALARKYELCPFELSLNLSETADVVICDYNYVFDPKVRLKRHFDKKNKIGLLIDEAHNLPDRVREMYSAKLSGNAVSRLCDHLSEMYGDEDPVLRALEEMLDCLTVPEAEYDARREAPDDIVQAAAHFVALCDELGVSDDDTVEMKLDAAWFVRVAARFDEDIYRTLIRPEGRDDRIEVKLWCFAPEKPTDSLLSRVGAAAMFSATLAPIDFYGRLLAVTEKSAQLSLESPFPPENLLTARLAVSVNYAKRAETMGTVVKVIHALAESHTGNYIACFPSHVYMEDAYRYYRMSFPDERAVCQSTHMSEEERRAFIERFENAPKTSLVAFIVLGGVFSEGVDLPEDRLSGAVIVSTGMPMPNPESELLREIYDDGDEGGQDAAYTYPGFRRVLQAAGRVIRTENDRGVVLLLDRRYASEKYKELMPEHWRVRKFKNMDELVEKLGRFWQTEE